MKDWVNGTHQPFHHLACCSRKAMLYIHFTRRAPPLFPFAPHRQKKAPAWSGVCVCECININVYVCACVCDLAPHFLAIFWQYEVGIPFFCKTPPPLNFFFCDYLPLYFLVYELGIFLFAVSCWMWCCILIWRDSVSLWYIDTT